MSLFDEEGLKREVERLEYKTADPAFWTSSEDTSKVLQNLKNAKDKLETLIRMKSNIEDVDDLIQMSIEEEDSSVLEDIRETFNNIKKQIEDMTLAALLNGKYDKNNAILTIHPGAGGTESQDWANMLFRMYTRWSEKKNYKVDVLDYLPGEEAGIKSVTIKVAGENAYGYLKSEMGVHRLVRISPFDANGRRHTSFSSIEVIPEIIDDDSIEINTVDLRVDTYRASGAGGQHVNKTESAIRITHIPTGIVVQCQNERSQIQNRETAMNMLKAKLIDRREKERLSHMQDIKGDQKDIAWGSQIRSYVFCPYTLVKDHRTNAEVGNVQGVMDGDIDYFINEYLKFITNAFKN